MDDEVKVPDTLVSGREKRTVRQRRFDSDSVDYAFLPPFGKTRLALQKRNVEPSTSNGDASPFKGELRLEVLEPDSKKKKPEQTDKLDLVEKKRTEKPGKPARRRQAAQTRTSPYNAMTFNCAHAATSNACTATPENWQIMFFTELGRSLVANPDMAETLVKVVPIMQDIVHGVVTSLSHTTDG